MKAIIYTIYCSIKRQLSRPTSCQPTSTAGNTFNFAVLDAFGYQFAPRYAKFKHRFQAHFKIDPSARSDRFLAAKKMIDWQLILDEWDNIIQILVSLDQRNATQALLVKKLCGYKKYKTLKALSEYSRAFQLIYLLDMRTMNPCGSTPRAH